MKKVRYAVFCIIKFFLKLFFSGYELTGTENLKNTPCIIVGNHSQIHAPIVAELFLSKNAYTWCAGEMMSLKEVPAYAYKDFWSRKPRYIKWFFKLLSYIIAPLCICIFSSAHTIAVYHDRRLYQTFKETVDKLNDNKNIVIFPEYDKPHNKIVCEFKDGFADIAKIYYNRTGKALSFVPMYVAPKLGKVCFCKPVTYKPENDAKEEKKRICNYLMDEITKAATSLPRHKVVPYNNVAKKEYVYNKEK